MALAAVVESSSSYLNPILNSRVVAASNPSKMIPNKKSPTFLVAAPTEPSRKIEMYSPTFYAACTAGGILSCGLTHMTVTPLDLVKCNIQLQSNAEAIYFDEGVRNGKRIQLESKALGLVHPAYATMLGHLCSTALETFKDRLEPLLNNRDGFAASVRTCTKSCLLEFDKGCADVVIQQDDWDASKVQEKLCRDIDAHVSAVKSEKLSELVDNYEKQLIEALTDLLESLLDTGREDTWPSIRKLLTRETETVVSEFSTAVTGFELDQANVEMMVQGLRDHAINVVEKKQEKKPKKY